MRNERHQTGPALVGDVMTAPAVTIDENVHVRDVARLLEIRAISSVPVVDSSDRLVGIVSEADLLMGRNAGLASRDVFAGYGYLEADTTLAANVMSRAVVTAQADDPLPLVARQMYEKHLRSMPVVKTDGTVLGVIARRDILRTFARPEAENRSDVAAWLRRYQVMSPSRQRRLRTARRRTAGTAPAPR